MVHLFRGRAGSMLTALHMLGSTCTGGKAVLKTPVSFISYIFVQTLLALL